MEKYDPEQLTCIQKLGPLPLERATVIGLGHLEILRQLQRPADTLCLGTAFSEFVHHTSPVFGCNFCQENERQTRVL